jgi:hypothetical protein
MEPQAVRNIIVQSWIGLTIVSVFPAPMPAAQRYAHHNDKQSPDDTHTHTGKSTVGDKASADTDEAMDKRFKSICRGC